MFQRDWKPCDCRREFDSMWVSSSEVEQPGLNQGNKPGRLRVMAVREDSEIAILRICEQVSPIHPTDARELWWLSLIQ